MSAGVVSTRQGDVRGVEVDGVRSYRGIPYAAAPVGRLRYRAPQPAPGWSGVRDASTFGAIAPQAASGLGSYFPGDPLDQSEDCLVCNVWTPETARGPLPVMVFVHGGAFCNGSGSGVMYRGDRLAARGVVVVTFNYRLGALGFLAHPALADEESGGFGNWGLLDQVAALGWVRDNIGAFGGDPSNVTVFGESAGAMSICDLLAAPAAGGLFRRAIAESGAALAIDPPPAARIAERLAASSASPSSAGTPCSPVPADELIGAQIAVNAEVDAGAGLPFQPVVDGGLLARHPEDAVVAGASAGVELLIGSNRDEFKLFSFAVLARRELSEAEPERLVGRYLRGAGLEDEALAGDAIAEYRRAGTPRRARTARALFDAIVTDWIFRVPQLRLAEAHRIARRRRTPTCSTGRRPSPGAVSAPATVSSCPSYSARCTSRSSGCSPGAGRTPSGSQRRCRRRGWPSPPRATRRTTSSGAGPVTTPHRRHDIAIGSPLGARRRALRDRAPVLGAATRPLRCRRSDRGGPTPRRHARRPRGRRAHGDVAQPAEAERLDATQ